MAKFRKIAGWGGAAVLAALLLAWTLVDPKLDRAAVYPGGTVLRDNAGNVLRVTLGPGDVDCRPYYAASTNDWIVQALVASEDRRFFSHWGVDVPSVLRACFQNVTALRRISGASTITMQATRLIAPHPRTLPWKCVEAVRALKTECRHDKLWIVSQYLNRAPFGSNLVGVEAAANGWFGKRARDLGIGEAALLAGMVQSPTRFRPDRHLDRALKRRAYVLDRMLALGMIDAAQHAAANASRPEIRRGTRPFEEPFFCDWAMRRVVRARSGGDVGTTLDADVQARARRAVAAASAGGLSADSGSSARSPETCPTGASGGSSTGGTRARRAARSRSPGSPWRARTASPARRRRGSPTPCASPWSPNPRRCGIMSTPKRIYNPLRASTPWSFFLPSI